MQRKGFTLLEVIVAIAIFVASAVEIIAILGQNSTRIYDSRLTDTYIDLAQKQLGRELEKGYLPEEEETQWEAFQNDDDEDIDNGFQWRLIRKVYEAPDWIEGSDDDEILRAQEGQLNSYMEYRVEVRRALVKNIDSQDVFALSRIVPPPPPVSAPTKVPVGTDNPENP